MTDTNDPPAPQRRWSFRTRLTITIAAAFVVAGVGLLAVQYLLVQSFFRSASGVTVCSNVRSSDDPTATESTTCVQVGDVPFGAEGPPENTGLTREALEQAFDDYSGALSQDVLGSLLIASVIVFAIFAVIAVLVAGWLARRSLSRIAEVTTLTRRITTEHLDRRLELAGPDDEIKELGDTIDDMLDRLHAGFEAQDRFIQNASHELRTPLTVTRAALEIPLEQGRVPTELEPAIRRALTANEHSERLIAALLVLARGRVRTAEREPVDLVAMAAGCVAEAREDAAARGVAIALETGPATEPAAASLSGEAELIRLAVRNLLDNAVRYNDERGVVTLRVDRAEGVTVESTGRELSEADVAALGEPFHRGDASRRADRDGFGLGLSIVRAVAAAHDGELRLRPREGGGLVAELRLAAPSPALAQRAV